MKPNLEIPCPTCHAAAGSPCINKRGQATKRHPARMPKPAAAAEAPTPAPPTAAAEETARTLLPIEGNRIADAARRLRSSGLQVTVYPWPFGRYAQMGHRCSLEKVFIGPYGTRDELQQDLPRLRHLIEEGCP